MSRRLIAAAAIAALSSPAYALTMQCNSYAAWHYPNITLQEYRDSFQINWGGSDEVYEKTTLKHFGVLIDGGFRKNGSAEETRSFVHDNISGIPVIIVDSIIFTPTCSGARLDAPKAELPKDKLWLLKPKL